MQAAQEYMGEVDERITRMATALPGGTTMRGGICGLLNGAEASIGLKYGSVIREERDLCIKQGLRVHDFFRELTRKKYGTMDCRDINGCDFTNPEEVKAYIGSKAQEICADLLVETLRFLLPLLDNPDSAGDS